MRKTFILILATMIVASGFEVFAQTANFFISSTGEKNEIKLNPSKKIGDDRSLFSYVDAWYDSGAMTVTVEGCELKDAFIYVMNADGLVLAQTSHYFGMNPDICIVDTPSLSGKYWLVIDSPILYAEGTFLIN